jgi:uncharacterized PurR-regulated membrane protein YhhQ (DUF165 family)
MKKTTPIILFAATVLLANWLTTHYGLVSVGFGLVATAGTYAAGLAFGLRDWCQETTGRRGAILAVIIGAALSAVVADGRIALASATAFLISELVDFGIYTPLRSRNLTAAVVASNTAGSIVDTLIFLSIAGFGVTGSALWGQVIGKGWMTLLAVAVLGAAGARRRSVA